MNLRAEWKTSARSFAGDTLVSGASILLFTWWPPAAFAFLGLLALGAIVGYSAVSGFGAPDDDVSESLSRASKGPVEPTAGQGRWVQLGTADGHSFALCRGVDGRSMCLEYLPDPSSGVLPEFSTLSRRDQLKAAAILLESLQGLSLHDADSYDAAQREISRELTKTSK